jgi:tight adherence protein C
VAFSISISFIAFMIPDFLLNRKGKLRQKSVKRILPSFIDYLTIAVEAGLGLDTAIFRVIKNIQGPLAEDIAYAMTEIKYGKTKKEAFDNLSKKVNLAEFTVFLNALVNGEKLGISLSSILIVQAQQIRQKRKQQIQEAAYKISIKLLFPLVLFLLPSLFIIILGPAMVSIYLSFVK